MSHNIRPTTDIKYPTGDSLYYKQVNSNEWYGPATVLAQDGQQVLVENRSTHVHVHPCYLQLIHESRNLPVNQTQHISLKRQQ